MTPHDFIRKWKPIDLSERSACQQHFLDLCELLNQPKPAEVDPRGLWFTLFSSTLTDEDILCCLLALNLRLAAAI